MEALASGLVSAAVSDRPDLRRLPVKQVTFAVIVPVTIAPEEEIPPVLLFVFTVAEIKVFPQAWPVAVINPVELTVTICGVFEVHVT
ncbi:MAG TPA: hypothetical protein VEI49_04675 [Terriglobales bacterium]|nr:hypothetical protein [Terriglobales bacterium]